MGEFLELQVKRLVIAFEAQRQLVIPVLICEFLRRPQFAAHQPGSQRALRCDHLDHRARQVAFVGAGGRFQRYHVQTRTGALRRGDGN